MPISQNLIKNQEHSDVHRKIEEKMCPYFHFIAALIYSVHKTFDKCLVEVAQVPQEIKMIKLRQKL